MSEWFFKTSLPVRPAYVLILALWWSAGKVCANAAMRGSRSDVENCNEAQKRCMSQMGCSIAIHNYIIHCSSLINGETNQCSYHCRMALISLLSTEDRTGETFMTCNCGEHQFCRESKSRLEACDIVEITEAVKDVYDPDIKLTCSLAEMICAADTSCFTALSYYEQHCRKLIKGAKCTARCNNSLSILYRQPKALKLRSCICDGMEKYDCPALRYNIETLCFNRRISPPPNYVTNTPPSHHTRSHHRHQNNGNDGHGEEPWRRPHEEDAPHKAHSGGDENQVDNNNSPHKGGGKSALTSQRNGGTGVVRISAGDSSRICVVLASIVIIFIGIL